jgi:NADH-quinone oxidoreductase subunit F
MRNGYRAVSPGNTDWVGNTTSDTVFCLANDGTEVIPNHDAATTATTKIEPSLRHQPPPARPVERFDEHPDDLFHCTTLAYPATKPSNTQSHPLTEPFKTNADHPLCFVPLKSGYGTLVQTSHRPNRFLLPETPITTRDEFFDQGGGEGITRALELGPEGTIETILLAGLRGRGGAGFSTGTKWASVRHGGSGTRYVVANGAEGEPASFKDRTLMRSDPYRIVEGAAIAAFAVGASTIYLATKKSYVREVKALSQAALELSGSGLLGDLTITIVEGPDEYLFGEEKALLEVIEGRDPLPRLVAPWQFGLFATASIGGWEAESHTLDVEAHSNPTVVNNVETLATAAHILAKGSTWFRSMGTENSPGTMIATVVGAVNKPGVHEVVCGTTFASLLERCGGPLPGHSFKAAFSGVSNPVLVADAFDTPLTYEDFAAAGSGIGAAGFVLYDDSTNMAAVAGEVSRFLSVESCGQCQACKRDSVAITESLLAIATGSGSDEILATIGGRLRTVTDANRCSIGLQEQILIGSILRAFPHDIASCIENQITPGQVFIPLIKDITEDGTVIYDHKHAYKQNDWTFRSDI